MRLTAIELIGHAGSMFNADDVFVSYSRRDASDYALTLSNELSARGYSCFLDQRLNEPGQELGQSVVQALSRCSMMVLIASPSAAQSKFVEQEIVLFRGASRLRPMMIIDVDGAVDAACWRHEVDGTYRTIVSLDEVSQASPRTEVIDRVVNAATFMRRNQRLRRTGGALGVLILGLVLASMLLFRQVTLRRAEAAGLGRRANEARKEAEQADGARAIAIADTDVAKRERDAAQKEKEAALSERVAAQAAAAVARHEAAEQEKVAESRARAIISRQFAAYAPELALAAAAQAFDRARTPEAEKELVRAFEKFEPFVPLQGSKELHEIAFNLDRSAIAASDWGPKVWALKDGRLLGEYSDGNGLNRVIGFSQNNRLVLTGYDALATWEVGSKEVPRPLGIEGYAYPELVAVSDDNTLMALWSEGSIRVHSIDGKLVASLGTQRDAMHGTQYESSHASLRFIPKSHRVVAITSQGELLVFDPETKRAERARLEGSPAGRPVIRPAGDLMAVATKGEKGELWRLSPLERLPGVSDSCGGPFYDFSIDGTLLAVGRFKTIAICKEQKLKDIWIETEKIETEEFLSGLSFSSQDSKLLAQTPDAVSIYDISTMQPENELRGRPNAFSGSTFVPGSARVLTWGPDGARLWSPRARLRSVRLVQQLRDGLSHYLSPDGQIVVAGSKYEAIWRLGEKLEPVTLLAERAKDDKGAALELRFDPTSSRLAIAGGPQPVIWDTQKWEKTEVPALKGSQIFATDAAGRIAVAARRTWEFNGAAIEIWDVANEKKLGELLRAPHNSWPAPVMDLTLSSDGSVVVASSWQDLFAWDIGSRRPFLQESDPDKQTKWGALTLDRRGQLLAAFNDRTKCVMVWKLGRQGDQRTAHKLFLSVEPESITALGFSADGIWLAGSTGRGSAKVWKVDTGALAWSGRASGPESAIAFYSDSRRVLTLGIGMNLANDQMRALVSEECFTCRELAELRRAADLALKQARVRMPE